MKKRGSVSLEKMYHFRCGKCDRWWSIPDCPVKDFPEMFCPWCGLKQKFDDKTPKNLK